MMKLVWLVVLASLACRLIAGRWPWQYLSRSGGASANVVNARRLLGVSAGASRQEILEAHRNLVALVHPDRGGSNSGVHEANEARDTLLGDLEDRSKNR